MSGERYYIFLSVYIFIVDSVLFNDHSCGMLPCRREAIPAIRSVDGKHSMLIESRVAIFFTLFFSYQENKQLAEKINRVAVHNFYCEFIVVFSGIDNLFANYKSIFYLLLPLVHLSYVNRY